MKDSAADIPFGEDCRLVRNFDGIQVLDQIQIGSAVWLAQSFKLSNNQRRDYWFVFPHFVLPPSNGQVATKRLAIIQVSANNGSLEVETLFQGLFPCG